MRWLGRLVRLVGWLLTPLVAWAASFLGAWMALAVAWRLGTPREMLVLFLVTGFVTAVVALLLWMWLLRHSARLRRTLHVDPEGLPVTEEAELAQEAEEAEEAEAAAVKEAETVESPGA
ncbi:MAG: hypothetical protein E4H38_01975 [Gemmatimonadales bacterium]|jgi:type II secretory pathway component PulM|nr:MAG: hypothetical protein E4H38_01975 [Gemmatimonadales bacterium]